MTLRRASASAIPCIVADAVDERLVERAGEDRGRRGLAALVGGREARLEHGVGAGDRADREHAHRDREHDQHRSDRVAAEVAHGLAPADATHRRRLASRGRRRPLGRERPVEDPPVGHVDRPARAPGELGVVGDGHDRPPLVDERLERVEHDVGRRGVQVAGGLVGDDQRRVVGQRPGDRDALLLPARGARRAACAPGRPCPTRSSRSIARSSARAGVHSPPKSIGSITFSTTVSVGSSWKNWKITPIVRPRHSAVLPSDRLREVLAGDGHRAGGRAGRCR